MVYIFGYGSLIDQRCRQCTFPSEQAYPARLSGFMRGFSEVSGSSHSPLVIIPAKTSTVNGVLIPFDEAFFAKLDAREAGYERFKVSSKQVTRLDGNAIEGEVYVYGVAHLAEPSQQTPILQSYLDICLHGCLSIGQFFADEFIASTQTWGCCLNDRRSPLYPRWRDLGARSEQRIDQLLALVERLRRFEA